MLQQVCTIGPSFFKMASGMHRCPSSYLILKNKNHKLYSIYFHTRRAVVNVTLREEYAPSFLKRRNSKFSKIQLYKVL